MQPPMCENVLEKHFCRELFGQNTVVGPTCLFRGKKIWFVTSISSEIAEILPIEVPSCPINQISESQIEMVIEMTPKQ